jgi:uncharacterized protein (TIGR02099 family)
MLRFSLYLFQMLWHLLFKSLLLLCLLVALVLVLFARLPDYPLAAQNLSAYVLGHRVAMARIDTAWDNWMPVLVLHDVRLGEMDEVMTFRQIQVRLDLIASLLKARPVSDLLRLEVAQLSLGRAPNGQWQVYGLPESGASGVSAWLAQLLRQSQVELHIIRLRWQDGEILRHFRNSRLLLTREGNYHRLRGEGYLPTLSWTNTLTSQGGIFQLNALMRWEESQLISARGDVALIKVTLMRDGEKDRLQRLHSYFSIYPIHPHEWQADFKNVRATLNGVTTQALDVYLKLALPPQAPPHILLSSEQVPSASWLHVAALMRILPQSWRTALEGLRPHGDVRQLTWRIGSDWQVRAELVAWHNRAWQDWPALRNWGGVLTATRDNIELRFEQRDLGLALPNLYAQEFTLPFVRGTLAWRALAEGGARIDCEIDSATAEISALRLHGSLNVPKDGSSPLADLKLHLGATSLPDVHRYVPDKVSSPTAMAWLRTALRSGEISAAEGILQGPLAALPFSHGEGRLQLHAQVSNGSLAYAPDWPALSAIEAEVVVQGRSLRVNASQGRIHHSRVRNTQVRIDDFTAATPVLIQGEVQAKAADALSFVANSPLHEHVKLDMLEIDGAVRLNLDLNIPLLTNHVAVKGVLDFSGNRLHERHSGFTVTGLSGRLDFTESGVLAEDLRATLFDAPLRLRLVADADGAVRLDLKGEAQAAFLTQLAFHLDKRFRYGEALQQLSGVTTWHAQVSLPPGQTTRTIHVVSDLYGLDVVLPAPLDKRAHQRLDVDVHVRLLPGERGHEIALRVGARGQGVWHLSPQGQMRGALRFGDSRTSLALPLQGIHVNGQLGRVALSDWLALLPSQSDQSATDIRLDVRLDQVEVAGQLFHNVHLRSGEDQSASWELSAQEAQGRIHYQGDQLTLDFSHLLLRGLEFTPPRAASPTLDPLRLPTLHLNCEKCYAAGVDLGQVRLYTRKVSSGQEIHVLEMETPDTLLHGRGYWLRNGQGQRTNLRLLLESTDFAATLKRFGFAEKAIDAPQARLEFNGEWPGSPAQFALKTLSGNLHLAASQGRLLAVEPGVGRIFGLFDLRLMPQRLLLDVRELFGEGFGFEHIRGDFTLAHGQAETDNLHIDGGSAQVQIFGRTGFISRDFDQIMTVTPRASSALPLAGALVGGVGGGVAMFLLNQLVQDQIDDSLQIMYQITGAWLSPVITRLDTLARPLMQDMEN